MLQLLQPVWMWLGAAIAIPVAIHLWNIKKGKVLQVGSIALLHESTAKRTMNVKLTELLLLLLRCLLILFLALVLSKPQWIKPFDNKNKGWVLIDKGDMLQTYQHFKPSIDSLLDKGYELHDFNSGFVNANLKDSTSPTAALPVEKGEKTPPKNYWQLIEALNKTVPANMPVCIFSNNSLNHFTGNRPAINLNLHWKTYMEKDSTETVADAYKIAGDSVRVVTTTSKPEATFYAYHDYAANGLPSKYASLKIDTNTLRVTIYDKLSADANYVTAAIETVRQFTRRNIKITIAHTAQQIPKQQDWLFWLSDEPANKRFAAGNTFMYTTGKITDKTSWITTTEHNYGSKNILYKQVIVKQDLNATQVLSNAFGEPLLMLEQHQNKVYQFYSRFNPQWSNLVWSEYFPQFMLQLLSDNTKEATIIDNRMIDTSQMQPEYLTSTGIEVSGNKTITTDLFYYAWLLVFLLFCVERLLSLKTLSKQYA